MDRIRIEKQARLVQYEIWHNREALFPLSVPSPLAMFLPDIAARALGVEYEHREQLGRFGNGRDRFETAGMIDRRVACGGGGDGCINELIQLQTSSLGAEDSGDIYARRNVEYDTDAGLRRFAADLHRRLPRELGAAILRLYV
jgi:hypothetical protein